MILMTRPNCMWDSTECEPSVKSPKPPPAAVHDLKLNAVSKIVIVHC